MSDRIRWYDGEKESFIGCVGTFSDHVFAIIPPEPGLEEEWLLSIRPVGTHSFRYGYSPEVLKQEAEKILRQFAASLGAVFPDEEAGR